MRFVYFHLFILLVWVCWNVGWVGLKPFDAEFSFLGLLASLEAIFLTVFVLMAQNQMSVHSDKRSELDLQISLITEHELTKLIVVIMQLAKKAEIELADGKEKEEISKDVLPEQVMYNLDKQNSKACVKI